MPDYKWVTDAPVSWVDWEHVAPRVSRFKEIIKDYGEVQGDTPLAERMNAHLHGASFIADLIVKDIIPERPVFEYSVAGQPMALLQLQLGGSGMQIKNLATHPGTQMAGGIMVEYALNAIGHYNRHGSSYEEGVVGLESYNSESTKAYLALGFTTVRRDNMVLRASSSAAWTKVSDQWRLAAYAATKYLATT